MSTSISTGGVPPRAGLGMALARNWWAVALRGVFAVIFGLIALSTPGVALLSLALIFAAYLLADGVFAIVSAVRAAERHQGWTLLLLEGVFDIAVGLLALAFPAGAVLGFVLVTAAWALLTGALMLLAAFRVHATHGQIWLALGGIVSLLFGVLLAASPFDGAVVLAWWLGAYALAFGVMLLVLAFRLRGRHAAVA